MSFEMTELDRRISNQIQFGSISAVDYGNAKVRVAIGGNITGWLPWLAGRAGGDLTWHAPEAGEQVVVLAPSGELNQGVVLAGLYQNAHPAPSNTPDKHRMQYSDGAVIEYDRAAHHLKAVLPAGGTLEIIADGGLAITGDITLTGDVIANGISLINHTHPGDSGGTTGAPT